MFLSSYRNTRKSLGELEKAVETLAYCSCSHSISRSPKPLLVFLKLCRNTVHVFYFLNNGIIKIHHSNFYFLNYNGSWERFFRWSPLYGVSYSFVGYPYDSVYSIFLSHFFLLYSILFIFSPSFFFLFLFSNLYNLVTIFHYRIHFFYAIKS